MDAGIEACDNENLNWRIAPAGRKSFAALENISAPGEIQPSLVACVGFSAESYSPLSLRPVDLIMPPSTLGATLYRIGTDTERTGHDGYD